MKEYIYKVSQEQSGERLDIVVAHIFTISRSQAQKWIKQGFILVNNIIKDKTGFIVSENDRILFKETDKKSEQEDFTTEKNIHIPIVGETDEYLIINKPAGILVHPTQAGEKGTITDWLREKYPAIASVGESPERPGIVHRLDKEASGLLVIAKTQPMFEHLKQQFQERAIIKEYCVLVHGVMLAEHDTIDFDIDRGKDGTMVSRPHVNSLSLKSVSNKQPGKEALTEFWVEKQYARFALLNVRIHSGRTHQIRVHFFAYNHPVVGDTLYVNKKLNRKRDIELGRLFLHARHIKFTDLHGVVCEYTAALPDQLSVFLSSLTS